MPTIEVQIRTVYGVDKVYPACPKATAFARIAGTSTLTDATLREIQTLGYEIVVTHPTVTLTGMGAMRATGGMQHVAARR